MADLIDPIETAMRAAWRAQVASGDTEDSFVEWCDENWEEFAFPRRAMLPLADDAMAYLKATSLAFAECHAHATYSIDERCVVFVAHLCRMMSHEWPEGIPGSDLIDWIGDALNWLELGRNNREVTR